VNKEDFPLVVIDNQRYRCVPELPPPYLEMRCEMCAACPLSGKLSYEMCNKLYKTAQRTEQADCSEGTDVEAAVGRIYIPEDQFQEYVVELVRRRVSG
jgi:hypothetical protein